MITHKSWTDLLGMPTGRESISGKDIVRQDATEPMQHRRLWSFPDRRMAQLCFDAWIAEQQAQDA